MSNQEYSEEVQNVYLKMFRELEKKPNSIAFHKSYLVLKKLFHKNSSSDWKFNSIHWALDTYNLIGQCIYAFLNLKSMAMVYKKYRNSGDHPSHTNPKISFYIDSACINMYTCRDKVALMVWSFFHQFNPANRAEVLVFREILQRLKAPSHFGFELDKNDEFVKALSLLSNGNFEFKKLEDYRHHKIHRWEPRVEMFGIKKHHGFPYVVFDYEKNNNSAEMKKEVIDGLIWSYEDVEKMLNKCLFKLMDSLTISYKELSKNPPFND